MAFTELGHERAKASDLGLFIDGSCRREPGFEMAHPSITALCRGSYFAPRLAVGHSIVYCTNKAPYTGSQSVWCLVAMLKVIQRFETHEEGRAWYFQQERKVPSNCMVAENGPQEFERTLGYPHPKTGQFDQDPRWMKSRDGHYRESATKWPVFAVSDM